jgi:hypothetical protein
MTTRLRTSLMGGILAQGAERRQGASSLPAAGPRGAARAKAGAPGRPSALYPAPMRTERLLLPALLLVAASCKRSQIAPEPTPPRASASASASAPGAVARPSTSAASEYEDLPLYPLDANPPDTSDNVNTASLEATREQVIDLVARFARRRGKAPDAAEIRQALAAPYRPFELPEDGKPVIPTRWGKLCRTYQLVKEEPIDQLCMNGAMWAVTIVVADFDGDGTDDFILFGTWTVAAHQDVLLGVYTREGDVVKPLPQPQEQPFAPDESMHHFRRPFLKKSPGGLLLEDTQYERWDASGASLGWAPVGEEARRRDETRTYLITRGRPVLQQTRIEEWDKKRGKQSKVIKATP